MGSTLNPEVCDKTSRPWADVPNMNWERLEKNAISKPQKCAKPKINMARKRSESDTTSNNNFHHFPPERVLRLLQGIKSSIALAEARGVSFEDLEFLSGRPAGTIGSWFEGARMIQLEFLFALLERVPSVLRRDLIDATCRLQPTLQHPKLAHDPIALGRLETLLRQRIGFTIIHGGQEHARAFVLNALGNSVREVDSTQQSVCGLEFQPVSAWAPVPGIIHLSTQLEPRQQVQRAWAKVQHVKDGSVILLGHVWNRIPHLHPEIVQLARRCHVLVADEPLKTEDLVRRIPEPVHIVTVSPAREQPEWIRVTIQAG